MRNCLVTKLKENLDNPNLRKLGEIILKMNQVETPTSETSVLTISNYTAEPCIVSVSNGGAFVLDYSDINEQSKHLTSIEISEGTVSSRTLYFINADFDIHISNKYVVSDLVFGFYSNIGGSYNEFMFMSALNIVNFQGAPYFSGDVNDLFDNGTIVSGIFTYIRTSRLKLSSIAKNTNATSLIMGGSDIQDDIAILAPLKSLATLNVGGTEVFGTVESLAEGMIAAGRTSGTLAITADSTQVTYNGSSFTTVTITFSNGSYTVA